MTQADYKNPELSIETRVADLLGRMTTEEKIAQLTSVWLHLDPDSGDFAPFQGGLQPSRESFDPKVVMQHGIGQITRPFGSRPIDPVKGAEAVNLLQKKLKENTRLGIPAICHEECLTGFMAQGATSFPSPLNFGATWDPDLIEQVGAVIRRQMRSVGTHQGLAPVSDVSRDARWGRVEETVGEDPYLVGKMVSAYVKGLQGPDLKDGVVATLKHFAGYSFSEGGRNFAPAHVGKREMADVFLLPFEMAVKDGGAMSIMNAYQDIDGEPPGASRWLLTEVLRDAWGFDGIVVSDYGSINMLYQLHHVAENEADAAALALNAGLDVELPNPVVYPKGLRDALDKGLLDESILDLSVARVLTMKFRLGLFENPYVDTGAIDLDKPEEQALAKSIAEKSIVLLTNDGVLPLSKDINKLAVIGPNASELMAVFGNYSFENHVVSTHYPGEAGKVVTTPTILEVLERALGADRIGYARGCEIMSDDTGAIDEAARLAQNADVALVVVGDTAGHFRRGTVGEGTDTASLKLPGAQVELVNAVIETGTPTVIVLVNGRPFAMPELAREAAAIVEAWFPGQGGAEAIADLVFGDLNPGGKTTLTFSQTVGTQPNFYNHKFLGPGIPRLPEAEPVFAFGHGLSYTEFEYSDLELSSADVPVDGQVEVTIFVKNTGDRAGDEVVQLYIQDLLASITRPVKELKGFARISLEPDETKRITFTLPADLLSFTGVDYQRIVEPGDIRVMVGSSSRDIRLEGTFTLTGETRVVGEDRALSSQVKCENV